MPRLYEVARASLGKTRPGASAFRSRGFFFGAQHRTARAGPAQSLTHSCVAHITNPPSPRLPSHFLFNLVPLPPASASPSHCLCPLRAALTAVVLLLPADLHRPYPNSRKRISALLLATSPLRPQRAPTGEMRIFARPSGPKTAKSLPVRGHDPGIQQNLARPITARPEA